MSSNDNSVQEPPGAPGWRFAPTRWTQVLQARGESTEAQAALGELCAAYWQPVFAFILHEGRDEETARDLTQEFFSRLLARHGLGAVEPGRGRFRSFLLGAVKHFLADERAWRHAAKRGGGQAVVSLEASNETDSTSEIQIPDPASPTPDADFDRRWALTVIGRALAALATECTAAGRALQFAILKPWLVGELEGLSQAEAARRLALSEGAVKVAIHRLRRRFRELIKAEIAATVDSQTRVQEELNYLLEVLCRA